MAVSLNRFYHYHPSSSTSSNSCIKMLYKTCFMLLYIKILSLYLSNVIETLKTFSGSWYSGFAASTTSPLRWKPKITMLKLDMCLACC